MFNPDLLAIIFSNVEEIHNFHVDFLRSIERLYNQAWTDVSSVGEIGAVFVQNVSFYAVIKKARIYEYSCMKRLPLTGLRKERCKIWKKKGKSLGD